MTIEQEQLYAQAYALQGDERVAFVNANGLSYSEFHFYAQAKKKARRTKRSTKTERKAATSAQVGTCALCEEELHESDIRRIDHNTGKVLHISCQLGLANVRALLKKGITLDRIADYLQVIRPAPPVDPFSPDAPDADV